MPELNQTQNNSFPEDAETEKRIQFDQISKEAPDKFLSGILYFFDNLYRGELSVGINLNLSGIIISGELIGESKYFEMLAHKMEQSPSPAPEISSSIRHLIEEIYSQHPELRERANLYPSFIHLKNAKIYQPGSLPIPTNGEGALWRGRLESVDGFFFGSLEVEIVKNL